MHRKLATQIYSVRLDVRPELPTQRPGAIVNNSRFKFTRLFNEYSQTDRIGLHMNPKLQTRVDEIICFKFLKDWVQNRK